MSKKNIAVTVEIERKDAALPRFVVVPESAVAPWALTGTTAVEVALNGIEVGRRNLKKWGRGRDCWFLDLPDRLCARVGLETCDRVRLSLRLTAVDLPVELQSLIDSDDAARAAWDRRTTSQRRMLCDHIFEAKQAATRTRRAKKALLGDT